MDIFDKAKIYFEQQINVYGKEIFLEKPDLSPPKIVAQPQRQVIAKNEQETISNFEKDLKNKKAVETPKTEPARKKIVHELSINPEWNKSDSLDELYSGIHNCTECPLGLTRDKFVFGNGNPNADIMVIGEAPGADEDTQGKPFVGRAGQLLTKILEAINLSRDEVFIANIIKCRPPNNRRPNKDEVEKCEPYLQKQIELIKPKFILSLGLTSVDTLLKKSHRMGDIRGNLMDYHGIKMLVTYHPAALLRNPGWKKKTWEDVQLLRKLYDEYLAGNS
jgi:uracil-DNA glycosylase family 4